MILNQRHGTEMLIQVTVLISILGLIQTSGAANNLSPSSDLIVHSVGVDDKKLNPEVLVKGKEPKNRDIIMKSDIQEGSTSRVISADKLLSTPHTLPDSEVFVKGDDVLITGKLTLSGEDLHAKLAKVMMWDPAHGVWAIRLGSTGQVVGAKAEKLRKLHKVQLEDLHQEEWTRVPKGGLEAQLLSFPKGVEIKIDLSTGEKLVRRGVS